MRIECTYISEDGVEFTHEADCKKHEAYRTSLTPKQRAAIYLHNIHCTGNHTDVCGWHYEMSGSLTGGNEVHNWDGSSHSWWLEEVDNYVDQSIKLLQIMGALPK